MTITSAVTMASSIHRYRPNARLASLGLGMGEGEAGKVGMLQQGSLGVVHRQYLISRPMGELIVNG
jgi:hypothetical protein